MQTYSKHLDMNSEIQKILQERRASGMFSNPSKDEKQKRAEEAYVQCGMENALVRRNKGISVGERQVESILRFIIDRPTQIQLEDAVADNIVYDQLGEHRILGKKKSKKKKKKMRSY